MRNVKYGTRSTMHKGFSFIEVMLSVFLMSAGMVAAISLIGAGIKESMDSRNQLIASLLTQEGVELVRNIRDNNWAQSVGTFTNISNGTWRIDIVSGLNAGSAVLNYDSTNNRYAHTGGIATKFSRRITVTDSGSDKTIIAMVIWKDDFPLTGIAGCTTGAGCSYAQLTLTRWNE